MQNFVDYSTVDPGVGPIEQIALLNSAIAISAQSNLQQIYSVIEHRVELQDNLMQILIQPEELMLLNVEKLSELTRDSPITDSKRLELIFTLSQKIVVEKRSVKSLP